MKSQISMEFLIGVTILIFVYVVSVSAFSSYTQNRVLEDEYARQICYTITAGVDSALLGGKGFTKNVSMPYKMKDENYFAFTSPANNTAIVTIDWEDGIFTCSMNTQNVNKVSFKPCRFSVNNINKTIYLSTVSTDKLKYETNETISMSGSYYITNVSLKIFNENNVKVYENNLTTTNNSFEENWSTTNAGKYNIFVSDKTYKDLNSERVIYVS